jgi:hypothetical protein
MLTAGIEDILALERELCVLGIASRDRSPLLDEIAVFQPDILILDENPAPDDLPVLFDQMTGYPDPKIIVVNQHKNSLLIYEKDEIEREIEVTQAADLIAVILSRQPLPPYSKELV